MTFPQSSAIAAPALATAVGWGGAALGLWLTGAHRRARLVIPLSAGVLLGVTLLGLLPELAADSGWTLSFALFVAGYGALLVVNRYIYAVCPTCSHDHNHSACATELHGFGPPLIIAAALHSFLDGWSVASAQAAAPVGLRVAVPLAVLMHKVPEGIALGAILRAAVKARAKALGWCVFAEGFTLVGGVAGVALAPHLGHAWTTYPLGITAGWLFYLGSHAVHEEWKRRGAAHAFGAAMAGVAFAALVQHGAEAFLR